MSPPWRWAFGSALLGLLAALVLRFPAPWAAGALERASGQRIALVNAQGTLWDGSAQVQLQGGAGSRDATTLPGRLAWRLRPGWGTLQITLHNEAGLRQPLHLIATRGAGGAAVVSVAALDWRGPAGLLKGLGTPWNTLGFEGDLALRAQHLQLHQSAQGWQLKGELLIEADSVSSRISTVRPLGSYRMALQGGLNGTTALALSTTQGVLQLQGEGAFIGGQLRFQGSARAAPERRDALGNVLNLIGHRDGPVALRILR